MGYIYLASPYDSDDPGVRLTRFKAACRAAGRMISEGEHVYSPIAHSHPIAVSCGLPRSWDFWAEHDRLLLEHADKVCVLMLDGFSTSRGVAAEIGLARQLRIPVEYVDEEDE